MHWLDIQNLCNDIVLKFMETLTPLYPWASNAERVGTTTAVPTDTNLRPQATPVCCSDTTTL